MKEAAAWLKARRRSRASTLGWSFHKENGQLDRAGPARKGAFHFMPMDELISLVEFSLTRENVVLAAGEPWRRSYPPQCNVCRMHDYGVHLEPTGTVPMQRQKS